jgi:hypothetical protein
MDTTIFDADKARQRSTQLKRVIIVEDCDGDPSDMFFADVEYDPDNPAIDWSEFNEAIDRGRVDKKWKIQ